MIGTTFWSLHYRLVHCYYGTVAPFTKGGDQEFVWPSPYVTNLNGDVPKKLFEEK